MLDMGREVQIDQGDQIFDNGRIPDESRRRNAR